jgi:hypothetical protein
LFILYDDIGWLAVYHQSLFRRLSPFVTRTVCNAIVSIFSNVDRVQVPPSLNLGLRTGAGTAELKKTKAIRKMISK